VQGLFYDSSSDSDPRARHKESIAGQRLRGPLRRGGLGGGGGGGVGGWSDEEEESTEKSVRCTRSS